MSKADYATAVLAIVHTKLCAREASSFCDFWKSTSCDFTTFFFFLIEVILYFLNVLKKIKTDFS